jgi:hypothetical protein
LRAASISASVMTTLPATGPGLAPSRTWTLSVPQQRNFTWLGHYPFYDKLRRRLVNRSTLGWRQIDVAQPIAAVHKIGRALKRDD